MVNLKLHMLSLIFIITTVGCSGTQEQAGGIKAPAMVNQDAEKSKTSKPTVAKPVAKEVPQKIARVDIDSLEIDDFRKEAMRNDFYVENYPDGSLFSKIEFKDTIKGREGHHRAYHKNGTLWEEFYSINGLREGTGKWYSENGVIQEEDTYKNDKLHGFKRWYHKNGKLKREQMFEYGIQNGITRWYDQEGNQTDEGVFKNGKRVQ